MSKKGWVFVILSALFLGLVEATAITLLPEPWRDFHPVLDVMVVLVALRRPQAAIVFAALSGLLLDSFQVDASAFAFGRLLLIAALLILVSERVLTNRSLYASLALVLAARFFDTILVELAHLFGLLLFHWDIPTIPFSSFAITLVWDMLSVGIAFLVLVFFTRRFFVSAPRSETFYERI